MLQWFIRFPEFAEFTEFLFHLGKTPMIPLIYIDAAGPTEIMTKSQVKFYFFSWNFQLSNMGGCCHENSGTQVERFVWLVQTLVRNGRV